MSGRVLEIPLMLVAALFGATVHEAGHALAAYAFGDRTAKDAGRLTLNPLKHIDLVTTIILPAVFLFAGIPPLIMFKPVPVNLEGLKRPRLASFGVSLAGPGANIILALVAALVFRLAFTPVSAPGVVLLLFAYLVMINLFMAGFNLLPIPPLDGSWILSALLPPKAAAVFQKVRTTFLVIFLFLIFTGILGKVLDPLFGGLDGVRKVLLGY